MSSGMSITAASMLNSMERLNVISHNLANANTTGYKRDIAISGKFESAMAAGLGGRAGETRGGSMNAAQVVDRFPDMSSGTLRYTGGALNVALEGRGFFQVFGTDEVLYSRDGSFQRDAAGRLVNARGAAVAGQSGEIHLSEGDVYIDGQGRIWQDDRPIDQLRVVDVVNPMQLEKRGAGAYASKTGQGVSVPVESVKIRQGYLETSNVAVMEEMVDLMSTLRHFEISQHAIKGYDEMIGKAIDSLGQF